MSEEEYESVSISEDIVEELVNALQTYCVEKHIPLFNHLHIHQFISNVIE